MDREKLLQLSSCSVIPSISDEYTGSYDTAHNEYLARGIQNAVNKVTVNDQTTINVAVLVLNSPSIQ